MQLEEALGRSESTLLRDPQDRIYYRCLCYADRAYLREAIHAAETGPWSGVWSALRNRPVAEFTAAANCKEERHGRS